MLVQINNTDGSSKKFYYLKSSTPISVESRILRDYLSVSVITSAEGRELIEVPLSESQLEEVKTKLENERRLDEQKAEAESRSRVVELHDEPNKPIQETDSLESVATVTKEASHLTESNQVSETIPIDSTVADSKQADPDQKVSYIYGYQIIDLLLMEKACEID